MTEVELYKEMQERYTYKIKAIGSKETSIAEMTDSECVKEYAGLLNNNIDLPISEELMRAVIKERNIDLSEYPEYFV